MKSTTLLFAFLFIANLALAQFGITGRYHINNAPDWRPWLNRDNPDSFEFLGNGLSVGVDYWLRLKTYRIEFFPELNAAAFENTLAVGTLSLDFKNTFYSFFLNTNIYPFDFMGDCNCPTFSKQGQFFKKGFFLQVSPAISRMDNSLEYSSEPSTGFGKSFKATNWAVSIGGGAGIDIGLSDFVTISPTISLRYFPNAKWESLSKYVGPEIYAPTALESAIWQWSAGVRLGFRFDYESRGRQGR